MAKVNRECYTCGQKYYHCPTCPSETKKETFYNMFCSERCSKIFKLLTDETFKRVTTEQCKDGLIEFGVSLDTEKYKEGVKKHIERVLNCETSFVESVSPVEETITEEIVVEETAVEEIISEEEPTVEEEPVVVQEETVQEVSYSRKKKRKNSEVDL